MRGKTQGECCSRLRFVGHGQKIEMCVVRAHAKALLGMEGSTSVLHKRTQWIRKNAKGENTAQLGSENTIAGGFKIAPVASVA